MIDLRCPHRGRGDIACTHRFYTTQPSSNTQPILSTNLRVNMTHIAPAPPCVCRTDAALSRTCHVAGRGIIYESSLLVQAPRVTTLCSLQRGTAERGSPVAGCQVTRASSSINRQGPAMDSPYEIQPVTCPFHLNTYIMDILLLLLIT